MPPVRTDITARPADIEVDLGVPAAADDSSAEVGRGTLKLSRVLPQAGKPLYTVVKESIRRAIEQGRYAPGERMPSTQQISVQAGVSLVTAHRALQELVAGGVLKRSQGRGTFVADVIGDGSVVRARSRVGLVFHRDASIADFFHSQILEGVRQAGEEMHVDLMLLRFGEDTRGECDGFLYVNPLPEELARVAERVKKDKPCVVVGARGDLHASLSSKRGGTGQINGYVPAAARADLADLSGAWSGASEHLGSIDTDNNELARRAVQHLWRLGHRRIGFVGGGDEVSNSRDRWEGFVEACNAGKVQPDCAHAIKAGGWRLDHDSLSRLVVMLRSDSRPTAIFAAGYYFALDVYAAAVEAGLSIPRDLSVVGVDDPPSAVHLSPPLTTLRQPLRQLGVEAVRMLRDLLERDASPVHRTLMAEIVTRSSTTTPA